MSHAVFILRDIAWIEFAQSPIACRAKKQIGGCFVLSNAANAPGAATICPSGNNGNMTVPPLFSPCGRASPAWSFKQSEIACWVGQASRHRPLGLERLFEPGFQEFAQLGRSPELRQHACPTASRDNRHRGVRGWFARRGESFITTLSSSGRLGAISRLTEVEDGRVQCGTATCEMLLLAN
jgi:hypothetical protein